MAEAAFLHIAVVLLKPSVLIGATMLIGVSVAVAGFGRRPELRLPVICFFLYFGFLLTLPWAQTRYMMPVFPILAIFAADVSVNLFRSRRRLAMAIGVLAAVALAVDYRLTYPDLNLNGYQWVGERYVGGRSSLGYRSIAHVGSDGLEQAVNWVARQAPPDSSLLVFDAARHIVRAAIPRDDIHLIGGFRDSNLLGEADYVVTTIHRDIRGGYIADNPRGSIYQYRYDREALERSFAKVFSVQRAFDIEVAAVWKRNSPG